MTNLIDAVLEGGPAGLPPESRRRPVEATEEKIKLRYLGGYEHFQRDLAADPRAGTVTFHWVARTKVAE